MRKKVRRVTALLLAAALILFIPASGKYSAEGRSGTVRLVYSRAFLVRAPGEPFSSPPNNLGTGEAGNGTPYTGATSGYFVVKCGVNDGWYYCYLKGGNSSGGGNDGAELAGYIHLSESRYYLSVGSNGFAPSAGAAYGLIYPGNNAGAGGSSSIHRIADTTGSGYEAHDLANNVIAVAGGAGGSTGFLRKAISGGTDTSQLGVLDNIGSGYLSGGTAVPGEIQAYCSKMVNERRGPAPYQPCIIMVYLGPDNPTTTTYTINT